MAKGSDNGAGSNGLDISNGSDGYSSLEPSHPPPEDDEDVANEEEEEFGESLPLVTPPSPGRELQLILSSHHHRNHRHHRGTMTMTVTSSNESDSGIGHDDDGERDDNFHDIDDDVGAGGRASQLTTTMAEDMGSSISAGGSNGQQRQLDHLFQHDHDH